jgi:NADP-dependent 3-hydroxy acid dehydrogenase YdfG
MNTISHKTFLITGASRGIGKAIALSLAAHDVNMGLVARSADELTEVQLAVISKGSRAEIFAGSVADEIFVNEVVDKMKKKFGAVDVMINNAGYGLFGKTENITAAEWDELFATNTKGTFLFCRAVIPQMKERQQGQIINIASDVARRTFDGGALYCASKFAQEGFSSAIRKELRPFKIRVSVVYSGLVDSSFHAEPQGSATHDTWLKNEDMASAVLYIASQPAHVVVDELMIHPISQDY